MSSGYRPREAEVWKHFGIERTPKGPMRRITKAAGRFGRSAERDSSLDEGAEKQNCEAGTKVATTRSAPARPSTVCFRPLSNQ